MNVRKHVVAARERPAKAHSSSTKSEGFGRTIAVDFGGIMVEYDGWKGRDVLGLPRKDVIGARHGLRPVGRQVRHFKEPSSKKNPG